MADVFPDLVVYNENGEPETIKYHLLSTLLLNELQKQNNEFQSLRSKFQVLQEMMQGQAAQIVALEQQNRDFESKQKRLTTPEERVSELMALTVRLVQSATQDRQLQLTSN